MPYSSIESVPAQVATHKGAKLSLAQANKWSSIFDSIKAQGGVDSPAAVAWTQFEKIYVKEGDKWVLRQNANEDISIEDLMKLPDIDNFEDINDMDVFKTGKHNGITENDKVIDDMVANFTKLSSQIRPKLKITHKESQEKLAGLASYGDVKSIYSKVVDGVKHLFANFINVPKEVVAFIKDRRFPERSIELYPSLEVDGSNFKNVLRNISLLGHEPPAVKGLEPVKLSDENGEYNVIYFKKEGGEKDMGNEVLEAQITKLKEDNKALNKKLAAIDDEAEKKKFQAQIDAKDEEIKKLTDANEKIADLEKGAKEGKEATEKLEKLQEATKKADIDSSIESLKKDGHILPAHEPMIKSLMEALDAKEVKKYSFEKDKEKELTLLGLFKEILQAQKAVEFKDQAPAGDNHPDSKDSKEGKPMKMQDGTVKATIGDDLDKKIEAYAKEHKVSYSDAMDEVHKLENKED